MSCSTGRMAAGRWLVSLPLVLCGCGLPHDADGTLKSVRGGTLRVGIVANQPWVIDRGAAVEGVEGTLVAGVAEALTSRIEWVRMPEFALVRELRKRQLDLVIGGFDARVPWAVEVALTRPYLESADGKAHIIAAPPGENAWLMFLDRYIETHKSEIASRLPQATP